MLIDTLLNEGMPNSVSDMLVVDGGNGAAKASGLTTLTVKYLGGGALTTGDGIRVVQAANGATTDPGAFVLGNRVAAGAYEYVLSRGGDPAKGGNANDQNWYLRNTVDVELEPSPPPSAPPEVEKPNYRVEVPLDMVVPALVTRFGLAMLGTYHDRGGEDYGSALTAPAKEGGPPTRGWGRVFGQNGDVKYDASSLVARANEFASQGPSYDFKMAGFQAGLDLLDKPADDNARDVAGVSLGGGRIDSDVDAVFGGKAGSAYAEGVSLGGYWTRKGASGWYIDGVAQAIAYTRIRTTSTLGESIDTTGWSATASIEGGYPFALGAGWAVEPQAQLVYAHNDIGGTERDRFGQIGYDNTDALYGRIGARLTKSWQADDGRPITAWARANIWSHFGSDAKTTFSALNGLNPVTLSTSLGGTWAQIGVGMSAQVARNLSAFGSVDYDAALGSGKGSGIGARVGLRAVW